ncbi:hypothetical protein QAD02_020465 [Eretmocerus hayati]|uniref:Uncharacterized protein n=1 Tax=Eretmocerus hayati TaxID=131215 RepID=A0ACC2PQP5_9HYME|nr:hypothetical protein QAD02_020465 [Eretmocerus hayati]
MFNDLDDCMVDSLIDSKTECCYNRKTKKCFEAYENLVKLSDNAPNESAKSVMSDRIPFEDLTNTASNVQQDLSSVDHSAGLKRETDPELAKKQDEKIEQQRLDFKVILFHPRILATRTEKCAGAGGAVYEKYLYDRKILIRIGAILKHEVLLGDLTAQEQEDDLQILRTQDEPKDEILKKWEDQFPNRAYPSNYQNHFELYTPLRSWYAPFVIAVAKERSKFIEPLQVLESRGQTDLAAALSLPVLLGRRMPEPTPPSEKKVQKRKNSGAQLLTDQPIPEVAEVPRTFGSELQDINDSLIYNAESPSAFSDFKTRRKNDSAINRRPVGPYITVVGDYANEGIVFNFMQAEYWREKSRELGNCIVIRIFFGHDDFTAGNGMGSHAENTNLGDVSAFLPGLPPHIVSKLSNIFLVDLFFANDKKGFGNSQVFSGLIADLNTLNKHGVNICVGDRSITVYFKPCLEVGDNKGQNEDLGFDPHLNSGRPCGICRATIGKCTFYQIEGWELTDLTCQDLMHDCFEGWANYTLTNICNDLIHRQSRFDLEYLNNRIIWLNKHTLHISDAIPLIKQTHLTAKHELKMSAAGMINFSKYFGLLVGDKMGEDANETNETWSLYILMRKIIDVLLSPWVVHGHIMKLSILIPEFLSSYIALYGELQYKFHSLVHIIRMLKKFGPLVYYWAMRLESKQRELRIIATTSSTSVNLLHTIALRHQLKLAYLKLTGDMRIKDVEVETVGKVDVKARASYFSHIDENTQIFSTNCVEYKGIAFNMGILVVTDLDDPDSLKFVLIKNIFIVEQKVFLLLQPHTFIYFDDVRHAYLVQAREAYVMRDVKHIPYIHPCALFNSNNSLYAVPKYIL